MASSSLPLPFSGKAGSIRYDGLSFRAEGGIAEEDEGRWEVVKAFFRDRPLVADHLASYNNFVEKGIHEMIEEIGPVVVESVENDVVKKVSVTFSALELTCKPKVDEDDRKSEEEKSSNANGGKSSSKDWKRLAEPEMSWLTNSEAEDQANGKAPKTSASGPGESSRTEKDDWSRGGDVAKANGKGKCAVTLENGSSSGRTKKDVDGGPDDLGGDDMEPPHVCQDTFFEEDFQSSGEEVMEDDPDHQQDGMDIDEDPPTKANSRGNASYHPGKCSAARGDEDADISLKVPSAGKSRRRKSNLNLLPFEARNRGMTYSSPIFVDVTIEIPCVTTALFTPSIRTRGS